MTRDHTCNKISLNHGRGIQFIARIKIKIKIKIKKTPLLSRSESFPTGIAFVRRPQKP
jgi:hypothetical protein